MPGPSHTVKIKAVTRIHSAISSNNGCTITRKAHGKLGIAREQGEAAERRCDILKSEYPFLATRVTSLSAVLTGIMRQERRLLRDIALDIYNAGWNCPDGDTSEITLNDPEWEDLTTSNAGMEFEAFHDLAEEWHSITGWCITCIHIQ
jgi:hypothetical protein